MSSAGIRLLLKLGLRAKSRLITTSTFTLASLSDVKSAPKNQYALERPELTEGKKKVRVLDTKLPHVCSVVKSFFYFVK